jgi:hypothetical protein
MYSVGKIQLFIGRTVGMCSYHCVLRVNAITVIVVLIAYFPKMKVGLSNHQSVCLSPTNNF